MDILVLGGTSFVGRHFVDVALTQGHKITLFNRGQTHPELFPTAHHLRGNRDSSDLVALESGEWDAVVDVNGYLPRHVREVANLLSGRVDTYCFISTLGVYRDLGAPNLSEADPVATIEDPTNERQSRRTYGPLKALGEQEAERAFPGHTVVVRSGILAGPHDPSDRFTYWVRRLSRNAGPVLGPARPDQPVQVMHAGDQGVFILGLLTSGAIGVFNSVGPDEPITFTDLIEACAATTDTTPDVTWASDSLLAEHGVRLPLTQPETGEFDGLHRVSIERARAHGLVNRSIAEAAADTLVWDRTRSQVSPLAVGPSADQEAELLALL